MQTEEILSAGIDIGTSTTQLVFSRMTLQNTGGFGKVPQIEVVSKEIIYESEIYFTPLLSQDEIDGQRVKAILELEYEKAGIRPENLATGAVIITGESSRKKNASSVVQAVSEAAGDFVVAAAGPDLESVLAGKGAGAAALSKQTGLLTANLDIGGGTTNICVFEDGNVYDLACLDIGGRLVKVDAEANRILYVAPKMQKVIEAEGLAIKEGGPVFIEELKKLAKVMSDYLAQSVGLTPPQQQTAPKKETSDYLAQSVGLTPPQQQTAPKKEMLAFLKTNHLLEKERRPELVTFSGGVASCMNEAGDVFRYGDIGVLLAQALQENPYFQNVRSETAGETMRATVIGAGNYSMNISGSTIEYTDPGLFPMKNIPVVKMKLEEAQDIEAIPQQMHQAVQLYLENQSKDRQIALAFKGPKCPSFVQLQRMAQLISACYDENCSRERNLILIIEADIGKALGQALKRLIQKRRNIICIDGIACEHGDFVDLGEPAASGKVIPVVVKTLIFHT